MIKIENVETYGWEAAIRGMRNPLNSWDKSDSFYGCVQDNEIRECDDCDIPCELRYHEYLTNDNDYSLMMKLAKAGSEHAKYRRMITVTCDVVAPLYWWKECDTYKVGTVANSCSTMHRIHTKEFTLDDFSHEHLYPLSVDVLNTTIKALNIHRLIYLETKEKNAWWQLIQLLPSSYNQRRTLQLNYEVLANMYRQRKSHKLDEWVDFCKWIETLPYSELITLEEC